MASVRINGDLFTTQIKNLNINYGTVISRDDCAPKEIINVPRSGDDGI